MKISARDMARFGHLMLNRGVWDGRRLLDEGWVARATAVQVPASLPDGFPASGIPGSGCYGFNWWVNGLKPDGTRKWPDAPAGTFATQGHNNNRMWVVPEWETVVVRLGLDEGVACLGCCWAMMTVMFAAGLMNLGAMALLGALMGVEKVARGVLLTRLLGMTFLAGGIALASGPLLG